MGFIPQKIAIVGASGRAAAYSAKQAGFDVCVADYFSDQDTQVIASVQTVSNYQDQLTPWLEQVQPSGWLYVGGIESYPDLIDQASQVSPLLGNGSSVLKKMRDPFYLQPLFKDHSFQFPETLRDTVPVMRDDCWLGKKQNSAGGLSVIDLEDIPNDQLGDYYFQQRINGKVLSASFLATDDQVVLLGITQQLVGKTWNAPLPYQYTGSIYAAAFCLELIEELNRIAQLLIQETGMQGLFGIDFVLNNGRCVVLEINPRYTASMELIEKSWNGSFVDAHVSVFTKSRTELQKNACDELCRGKLFLFAQHDFTFETQLYEQLKRLLYESLSKDTSLPWIADIPQFGTAIKQSEPIFTIFAESNDEVEVERQLKKKAEACQLLINQCPD